MEKPESKYKAGVVIGSNKPRLSKLKSKKLVISVILLVAILVLGAISTVIFITHRTSSSSVPTKEQKAVAAIESTADNNLDKAKQQYQQFADSQKGNSNKATYLKGKGNLCLQHEDYKCVIESYEAADKLVGEDYDSAYSKGYAYEKLGEKNQAKASYEQVKVLIKNVKDEDLIFDRDQVDSDIKRMSE